MLEVLWAFDRLNKTTLLSAEEKQIITRELAASLPPPMIAHGVKETSAILLEKLIPSIKPDEVTVGRTTDEAPAKAKKETAKEGSKLHSRS